MDRKRSRRKGEREEIKSRENREFEQCAEVESSENEPRKTDQAMDKIVKALTTDMKKTSEIDRLAEVAAENHICGSHYL